MSPFDQIHAVMAQLGEKLDCLSVTEFEQRRSWIVVIDEETAFEVALDEKIGLLQLVSTVAKMPDTAGRQQIGEMLLRYNDQWHATGGVRFGLDPIDDSISIIASFPAVDIEPVAFAQRLRRLAGLVADWRNLIAGRAGGCEPAAKNSGRVSGAEAADEVSYLIKV